MNRLINKVVVVTGGGSGIGQAIAERFAAEGAAVVLAGRHLPALQAVVTGIESRRGRAHAVVCDVTVEADVKLLVEEAQKRFSSPDVWVNSAGVMVAKPLTETTTSEWDQVIDTNLKGTYLGCREAFSAMQKGQGGVIINISSLAGKEAWAGLGLYSASKFGVQGLTHALADEGTAYNIRVSAICPGAVNTPMMKGAGLGAEALIQPEDVAEAVMYLAHLPKNVVIKELVLERRGAE